MLVVYGSTWYHVSMAYIVKRKNREGKEYVYLIESFREGDKVKNRTLQAYGALEELERKEVGAFERLRREAKEGKLEIINNKKLQVEYDLDSIIVFDDKAYGWLLLDDLFNYLQIDGVIKKAFPKKNQEKKYLQVLKLLVYQRILNPGSKYYTYESQKQLFGNWNLSDNIIYRALSPLESIKDQIQLQVHKRISNSIGRTGLLVFYDVTNYSFEIDYDDPHTYDEQTNKIIKEGFRRKGPCKSNSGNPIVQMGLFMDSKGIPISYMLFRGNQTDPVTYIPAIEKVKKQFGIERIVVVADKAMNSKKNVSLTHENKDGWLFSLKHRGRRGAPKDVQDFILDPQGWVYNPDETFAWKSTIRKRKLDEDRTVEEKLVVTWNKKYDIREKIRREGALEYAEKLTDAELFRQTAKRGGKRYLELSYLDKITGELKPFSPLIHFDEKQIEFDQQFDGINVLVTSELDMSEEEMIKQYSQLHKIEDCFKVTKTDLLARPVHVRLQEHINAHFFTCFLGLVLIRILQNLTDQQFSPARLVKALQSARSNKLTTGYHRVQANEDLRKLTQLLNIDWDKNIVKYEALKNFSKGWYTTKINSNKIH